MRNLKTTIIFTLISSLMFVSVSFAQPKYWAQRYDSPVGVEWYTQNIPSNIRDSIGNIGCAISSIAMALHPRSTVNPYYDHRIGSSQVMTADPYSVYQIKGTAVAHWHDIGVAFGLNPELTHSSVTFSSNATDEHKAKTIAKQ